MVSLCWLGGWPGGWRIFAQIRGKQDILHGELMLAGWMVDEGYLLKLREIGYFAYVGWVDDGCLTDICPNQGEWDILHGKLMLAGWMVGG